MCTHLRGARVVLGSWRCSAQHQGLQRYSPVPLSAIPVHSTPHMHAIILTAADIMHSGNDMACRCSACHDGVIDTWMWVVDCGTVIRPLEWLQ